MTLKCNSHSDRTETAHIAVPVLFLCACEYDVGKGEGIVGNQVKATGRALSIPAGVGIGTAGAMIWTILGAAVTALLVSREVVTETAVGYGALFILVSAAFISAKVSYQKIKHRRAMVMAVSGCAYFLCLLAMNALFFGGQYAGVGVTAAAILAGCVSAMLLGNGGKRGKRGHQYKIPKR